jgi:hypothetical protein
MIRQRKSVKEKRVKRIVLHKVEKQKVKLEPFNAEFNQKSGIDNK